jgi:tRNA(Ile2) C34 agmatinyltransferase TiaS
MGGSGKNLIIFRVSLLFSILGIVLIYLTTSSGSPERVDTLSREHLDRRVEITGVVSSKYVSNGHVFITLDSGARAVAFNTSSTHKMKSDLRFLRPGERAIFTGKVSEYKGKLELIVEDVERGERYASDFG